MTGIKEDQPCFTPHKASVSLKHTSVSVMCISFKPIEVTIFEFAHNLIQHNSVHTKWITKDYIFIRLVTWLG